MNHRLRTTGGETRRHILRAATLAGTAAAAAALLPARGYFQAKSGRSHTRHRDVLSAECKERARIRSEKGIRWGGRPLSVAA